MNDLNEIQKTFLYGETLESSELNMIISLINSSIRKINGISNNLDEHKYDVSIPITNIYCRTKKGIGTLNFFPQSDSKKRELFNKVVTCSVNEGIKYNTNFYTVDISDNSDLMNGVWTAYPLGVSESLPHEWEVSFKKVESTGEVIYMFGPVLRSNYGYNGSDGDSILYVYKLFNKKLSPEEELLNLPQRPSLPNSEGEFIPSGWTDEPQGPTSDYPYEYVATLKRLQGEWGNFEKISLWSTYSKDGTNGDFQHRVFCRFAPTLLKSSPNTPIGGTYENPLPGSNDGISWSSTIPSGSGLVWTSIRVFKGDTRLVTEWSTPSIEADSNELDIEYSSSIERPNVETLRNFPKTPHPSVNVWHDPSENIDLSAMIWRAERKIKNGLYDGKWVITRMKGERGSFKSIVFRRFKPTIQQSSPATPTGGTYNNPIPDGNLWFDGITGTSENGPIWSSVCTFYDDGTSSGWSTPSLLSDSNDLDIEFSPLENLPKNPTGEPFSNREADGWYDPSSVNFDSKGPMIWRAERKVNNNVYEGDWTVTRIYGEKGDPGFNGDFTSRVFCRSLDKPATPYGGDYNSPTPENRDSNGIRIWSDGVPTTGPGKIWTSYRKFYGNTEREEDEWSDPTIECDSNTLDIEYSDNPTEPSTDTLRDTPGGLHPSDKGVNWYDPSNIPAGVTVIWRAERKISGTVYDGPWTISRILGERGAQGYRGDFVSRVFRRSSEDLGKEQYRPTGGSYDTPVPSGWSDGIPTSGSGKIWSSYRKFYGDPALERTSPNPWSIPTLEADSKSLDIEYSDSLIEPGIGTLRDTPGGQHPSSNVHWYDPSDSAIQGKTIIWRAERKISGTEYDGKWVISRILGERGELGYRGDFISRVFCRNSSKPSTPSGGDYDHPIPTDNDSNGNKIWSDGIPATGVGKIWSSTRKFYGLPGQTSNWSEPTLEADSESLDIEYSIDLQEPSKYSLREKPGDPHPSGWGVTWYDPSKIDEIPNGEQIIWRAERKISGDLYVGEWAITRILGETGPQGKRGKFKSFVFKRSDNVISEVTDSEDSGVTYDNPIPSGWYDSIPTNSKENIWMATSMFTGNNDEHTTWVVTLLTDNEYLDIEFSPDEVCPNAPTDNIPFSDRSAQHWYDANALNGLSPIWRAERKVFGQKFKNEEPWVITRIAGEKGDPGRDGSDAVLSASDKEALAKAGIQVVISPSNIILDLSDVLESNIDDKIDDVTSLITVLKTGDNSVLASNKFKLTNVKIFTTNGDPLGDNYITVQGKLSDNNKTITIKNLPISESDGNYTYSLKKGYIEGDILVEISLGVLYTIKFNIPWYLNTLGERIEKLKGDISETYLSRSVFSSGNSGNTVKLDFDAYINLSAKGTLENYSLVSTDASGNTTSNVPTLQAFGEFQRDATSNISKLSKSITGTNLLSDNWTTFSSPVTITSGSGTVNRRATKVSPQIPLSEGIYILSWYSAETSPYNFKISIGTSNSKISGEIPYITNNDITWLYCSIGTSSGDLSGGRLSSTTGYEGDYYERTEGSSSVRYVRFYCRINVNTKLYYSFVISTSTNSSATYPVIRPQLELCLAANTDQMPTPWVPGPLDFSSEIKLTADSISLTVSDVRNVANGAKTTANNALSTANDINSNLALTGIKISGENRRIDMYADKFSLKDSSGNIVFGKDPNSNNVKFTGDVLAKSLTAGDPTDLHIVTSANLLLFVNGDTVVGRFVVDGYGLLLFLLNDQGVEYKINWDNWESVENISFTPVHVYSFRYSSPSSSYPQGIIRDGITIYKDLDGNYKHSAAAIASTITGFKCYVRDSDYGEYDVDDYNYVVHMKCQVFTDAAHSDVLPCAYPVRVQRYKEVSIEGNAMYNTGNYVYYTTEIVPKNDNSHLNVSEPVGSWPTYSSSEGYAYYSPVEDDWYNCNVSYTELKEIYLTKRDSFSFEAVCDYATHEDNHVFRTSYEYTDAEASMKIFSGSSVEQLVTKNKQYLVPVREYVEYYCGH